METRSDSYKWVMLVLAWFDYFSFGVVLASLAPMANFVLVDLHLNLTEMGTVFG